MKKEKIYLAGKVTGDPKYREKFAAGVRHFEELNWRKEDIVNPAEECPEGWPWWRCMLRCVKLLLGCGFVAMLPDWRESRGARVEHWIARMTMKWIVYVDGKGTPRATSKTDSAKKKGGEGC